MQGHSRRIAFRDRSIEVQHRSSSHIYSIASLVCEPGRCLSEHVIDRTRLTRVKVPETPGNRILLGHRDGAH
jgi:hypothetical protein